MEAFSILKALDFSLPAIGKSVSVVIKGLIVLLLIAALIWGGYVTFVKPHTNPTPTTTQSATDDIVNNYYYPQKEKKFFLGIRIFGFDIGVAK